MNRSLADRTPLSHRLVAVLVVGLVLLVYAVVLTQVLGDLP